MKIVYDNLYLHEKTKKQHQYDSLFSKIDDMIRQALYKEVSLENKPALVCPNHNGGHEDMDYDLFLISIQSLAGYFKQMCELGYQRVDFEQLRQCAIQAEQKMLMKTQGINTHRGAIFNLGMLSASIGRCVYEQLSLSIENIINTLIKSWQDDLLYKLPRQTHSHGQIIRQKYGLMGAIEQVAYGFPTVREWALPCLKNAHRQGLNPCDVYLQTLIMLMSKLDDSNMVWRGGLEALTNVQQQAHELLMYGGVSTNEGKQRLKQLHEYCLKYRLSAGGSADLLSVTIVLAEIEHEFSSLI